MHKRTCLRRVKHFLNLLPHFIIVPTIVLLPHASTLSNTSKAPSLGTIERRSVPSHSIASWLCRHNYTKNHRCSTAESRTPNPIFSVQKSCTPAPLSWSAHSSCLQRCFSIDTTGGLERRIDWAHSNQATWAIESIERICSESFSCRCNKLWIILRNVRRHFVLLNHFARIPARPFISDCWDDFLYHELPVSILFDMQKFYFRRIPACTFNKGKHSNLTINCAFALSIEAGASNSGKNHYLKYVILILTPPFRHILA